MRGREEDGSVVIFDRKSWIVAAESRGNPLGYSRLEPRTASED